VSAFMVSREHVDLIVSLAVEGPRGVGVSPDSPVATSFPVRWYAKRWHEIEAMPEFENSRRRVIAHPDMRREPGDRSADEIGQMLVDANARSVMGRYPDTILSGELPGPNEPYWQEAYAWRRQPARMTAVEGLKAIACLDYQSCEYREWGGSEARRFLDALEQCLIGCLDGYGSAPWSWDSREIEHARRVTG
jgi:hypothetical protein